GCGGAGGDGGDQPAVRPPQRPPRRGAAGGAPGGPGPRAGPAGGGDLAVHAARRPRAPRGSRRGRGALHDLLRDLTVRWEGAVTCASGRDAGHRPCSFAGDDDDSPPDDRPAHRWPAAEIGDRRTLEHRRISWIHYRTSTGRGWG